MLIVHASGTARTLDVSTRTFGLDAPVLSDSSGLDDTTKGRNISFLPSLDTSYSLWYKYRYVTVVRNQVNDGPWQQKQTLHIRYVCAMLTSSAPTDWYTIGC